MFRSNMPAQSRESRIGGPYPFRIIGFRNSGLGFRIIGFRNSGLGFRIIGFRNSGFEFRI